MPSHGSIPASRNSTNVPPKPAGGLSLMTYAKTNALRAHRIAGIQDRPERPREAPGVPGGEVPAQQLGEQEDLVLQWTSVPRRPRMRLKRHRGKVYLNR